MSSGHFHALRILHQTFRRHSPSARAHILIRYLTAPFLRTLDLLPAGSRMLDIGAGHGTFARLAVENGVAQVIMVEPDLRKALLPLRHPRIRVVASFDDAIRGQFDVVSIYDATYRIPLPEREKLYAHVWDLLRPGGLFLLKDMDPDHRWKMKWARLQERLSDRFLRISLGEGFIYENRRQIEDRLRRLGFTEFTERKVDFGYPHSHVVYTARKPAIPS